MFVIKKNMTWALVDEVKRGHEHIFVFYFFCFGPRLFSLIYLRKAALVWPPRINLVVLFAHLSSFEQHMFDSVRVLGTLAPTQPSIEYLARARLT